MINPQPEISCGRTELISPGADMMASGFWTKLALRMKRRNTVSVTPAMGARIVAGTIRTLPIWRDSGTRAFEGAATILIEFSQNLCTICPGFPHQPVKRLETHQHRSNIYFPTGSARE